MIEAKKITLNDMFIKDEHSQIRIPDYQRGYSWENEQVADFFNDLVTFAKSRGKTYTSDKYFLGPIVIMRGSETDSYFYAVDGQQRIATFLIFISIIRDLSDDNDNLIDNEFATKVHTEILSSKGPNGNHRWSLRLGDLDLKFFENYIQKRPRNKNYVPRVKSNGRIKKARNLLERKLIEHLSDVDNQMKYFEMLYDTFVNHVEMVAIEVDTDRDAMNVFERINVRGMPLSESDLVRHRLMSGSPVADRPKIRRTWDELESLLGNEEAKIDNFIRHMWLSYHGEIKTSKFYDLISEYLNESLIKPLDFAEQCVQDCLLYTRLLRGDSNHIHNKSRETVRVIHATLGVKDALPLLLSAYRRFGRTPEFSELAHAVESLVVRYKYFAGHELVLLKEVLFKTAKIIEEASTKEGALKKAKLRLKSISPSNRDVITGVDRLMKINKLPALYILRQLENHYSGNDALRAEGTLEHIFPQKSSLSEWPRKDNLEPYLSHIGNLALLANTDNIKASNRKYVYKKKNVYAKSSLQLTVKINDYLQWGVQPILRRAKELAKLANERWPQITLDG